MMRRRFRPALDALEGRIALSDADGMGPDPFLDSFAPAEVGDPDAAGPAYLADDPSAPPVDSDPDSAGSLPPDDPFLDPFAPDQAADG